MAGQAGRKKKGEGKEERKKGTEERKKEKEDRIKQKMRDHIREIYNSTVSSYINFRGWNNKTKHRI